MNRPRSSRQHYDAFRRDYAQGTLDDKTSGLEKLPAAAGLEMIEPLFGRRPGPRLIAEFGQRLPMTSSARPPTAAAAPQIR